MIIRQKLTKKETNYKIMKFSSNKKIKNIKFNLKKYLRFNHSESQ